MTEPILAFIEARLADDERIARTATAGPWRVAVDEYAHETDASIIESAVLMGDGRPQRIAGPGYVGGGVWRKDDATHIARRDPARALREVAAKRLILRGHRPQDDDGWDDPPDVCARCRYDQGLDTYAWPCPTVRALAAVWSEHPDYDPAWAVTG